ncbi:MAG: ion transporter [Bdellovibrionales bacterium]|nr:ion transporter [Bdellovibrionales bacterium]
MESSTKNAPNFWSILNLVISVLAILILFVSTVFSTGNEIQKVLQLLDFLICIFFSLEFFIGLIRSKRKILYFRQNWLDLVASIPTFDSARFARLFKVFRLIRAIRGFKSVFEIHGVFFRDRISNSLGTAGFFAVISVFLSAIAVLQFEDAPDSNIKTAGDALWWAYSTVTTVGYGDRYPVTTEGRIIGALLMTIGVGTFGVFTASISALIMGKKDK